MGRFRQFPDTFGECQAKKNYGSGEAPAAAGEVTEGNTGTNNGGGGGGNAGAFPNSPAAQARKKLGAAW